MIADKHSKDVDLKSNCQLNNKRIDMRSLIGTHDVVFITLDTLRFDVAQQTFEAGELPNLSQRLGPSGWEERHTAGSFTYAAHHAFFAGYLPTPVAPGPHPRLFAAAFPGSETTDSLTYCFDQPEIASALRSEGYRTICIGGVGFFNQLTPLGSVLPNLFDTSVWNPSLSVVDPESTRNQVETAIELVSERKEQPVFLFINVSALHQPNCIFVPGATVDSKETQAAALRYVDEWLGRLFEFLENRGPGVCIICSDHGTAYGEDGYTGHRLAHSVVWRVPYGEFLYGQ